MQSTTKPRTTISTKSICKAPQNPYTTQPQQPQYQQQMYQPNYDARVSPPKPPTIDPTQPQILPPGPITEPTQQQIQQVVGTQFYLSRNPY